MYRIEFIPSEQMENIIPLLQILDDKIEETVLRERLTMMKASHYKCVGIYDEERLIGVSGMWMLVKYYVGKHIEPDNVIIHPDYRGKGAGEQLVNWMHDYAINEGFDASELNCYVGNHKGVQFWIRQGYRILGFHMQKKFSKK